MLCANCKYDLSGLPTMRGRGNPRCPECGHRNQPADPRPPLPPLYRDWFSLALGVGPVLAALGTVFLDNDTGQSLLMIVSLPVAFMIGCTLAALERGASTGGNLGAKALSALKTFGIFVVINAVVAVLGFLLIGVLFP